MRKTAFFILFMMTASVAFSQVKLAVRTGLSSSNIKTNDILNISQNVEEYRIETVLENPRTGFHFGIMSQISVPGIPIMLIPEVLFTQVSSEVKVTASPTLANGLTVAPKYVTERFRRIDVPFLVAFKTGPFRFQAGPVGSYVIGEDRNIVGALQDLGNSFTVEKGDTKTITMGYQAGIGFNLLKKLAFDFKYEGSLSKISDGVRIGNVEGKFDQRVSQYIFSIGYFL